LFNQQSKLLAYICRLIEIDLLLKFEFDIEIENGGLRLIRVRDDGRGIHKDDLSLSLSRHATSKIHQFEDLDAIETLGFRGEALASVSTVSRLTFLRSSNVAAIGKNIERLGFTFDFIICS
jgi:DNA mismatch repair protein MutL